MHPRRCLAVLNHKGCPQEPQAYPLPPRAKSGWVAPTDGLDPLQPPPGGDKGRQRATGATAVVARQYPVDSKLTGQKAYIFKKDNPFLFIMTTWDKVRGITVGSAVASIRKGEWVTPRRIKIYPIIVFGISVTTLLLVIFLRDGVLDPSGKYLGTDYVHFWAASNLLWQGRPEAAYDLNQLRAIPETILGTAGPNYAWLYPPTAFLVIFPLALFPYLPGLAIWLGITFCGYLSALWRILPNRWALVPMVAFPPVFITLGHGQNALLSTGLLGWGLTLLPRRPWLGGALMGMLIYKPHLGLMIPVALFSSRNWRALFGAGLSALGLIALSYVIFGAEVWKAFWGNHELTRIILEQGFTPWQKMISAFGAARMLGASTGLAWTIQIFISLLAATLVWRVWRKAGNPLIKAAALSTGALLATPLAWDYDATLLGIALAALVADGLRRGFLDWEVSILAWAWVTPLFWRPLAMSANLPLGLATLILLLWVASRRSARTWI